MEVDVWYSLRVFALSFLSGFSVAYVFGFNLWQAALMGLGAYVGLWVLGVVAYVVILLLYGEE